MRLGLLLKLFERTFKYLLAKKMQRVVGRVRVEQCETEASPDYFDSGDAAVSAFLQKEPQPGEEGGGELGGVS